ncbi:GDSL-type esterase/lipase family protein [Solimonas sp. SE-A11]|uniref:GDSL-type esterase/lipase family protein n=1 Tax=Solimonas sp. SE-A11 TaxID=3054954 RepID=UPI00259C9B08|nr:GDSL-type esterase/lipase family protein [Solimonas sp. SE-A11]MDM4769152.1 GDSL-type esterase/lipase family protein [Solimonas sp. SE-A11]
MNPVTRAWRAWLDSKMSAKLWEQMRSTLDATAPRDCGGVLFLGDSITILGRWELLFPGLRVLNFGIPGERSEHLLARLEPVVRVRPDKLFLMIGTNDLSRGVPVPDIASNVEKILVELRRELPECRLFLQTVLPCRRKLAPQIQDLNARYAAIAASQGLSLIDLYPLFDDGSGQIRRELSNDQLHLLGPGYAIWGRAIVPAVLGS